MEESRDDASQTQDMSEIQIPSSHPGSPNGLIPSSQLDSKTMRLSSPASIPASSITPPPSAQQPAASGAMTATQPLVIARTPSPMVVATMNSPPPTEKDKDGFLVVPSSQTSNFVHDLPSPAKVDVATIEELRAMVSELSLSLREARTTAAHHNLQHNMLLIESNKEKNAMAVELAMVQRELEVLQEQQDDYGRRGRSTPRQSIEFGTQAQNQQLEEVISDLRHRLQASQDENDNLRTMLNHVRRTSDARESRITALEEQNERLRQRIKENREHVNGLLDSVGVFDRSPPSVLNTPGRTYYATTPSRTSQRESSRVIGPTSTPSGQERRDNFDALLLADKVLSQESNTAPSTPKSHRGGHRSAYQGQHSGHVRNTHSLSSLPSTPVRNRAPPTAPFSVQPQRTPLHHHILEHQVPATEPPFGSSRRRRRASSDSTISVDSDTDIAKRQTPSKGSRKKPTFEDHEVDEFGYVPESQASRAAGEMLRSFGSNASSSSAKKDSLKQTKIVGQITKGGLFQGGYHGSPEKRRIASGVPGPEVDRAINSGASGSPKKRRVDGRGEDRLDPLGISY